MKIKINFKSPNSVSHAVEKSVEHIKDKHKRKFAEADIHEKLSKWIEFREYCEVEFDLDKMVATVL